VYATPENDDGATVGEGDDAHCAVRFVIHADPDVDLWARVAGIFLLAQKLPVGAVLSRDAAGSAVLTVELQGISATAAESVFRKAQQLTSVTRVAFHQDECRAAPATTEAGGET
jgi:hypothetical protein